MISHSEEDDNDKIEGEINFHRLKRMDDENHADKEFKSETSQYPRNSKKNCGEGSVRSCESHSTNDVHDTVQSALKNSGIACEKNQVMNANDSRERQAKIPENPNNEIETDKSQSEDYTDYEYLETLSNDIPEYIDFEYLSESSLLLNTYFKS